jgi:hypothetical protein
LEKSIKSKKNKCSRQGAFLIIAIGAAWQHGIAKAAASSMGTLKGKYIATQIDSDWYLR